MNMMIFIGMCVLAMTIIGGYFVHQENKREAAAEKKEQSSKETE